MSLLLQTYQSLDDIIGFVDLVSRKFYQDVYGRPMHDVRTKIVRWEKKDFGTYDNPNNSFPRDYKGSLTLPSSHDVLYEAAMLHDLAENPQQHNLSAREVNRIVLAKPSFGNAVLASGEEGNYQQSQIRTNIFDVTGMFDANHQRGVFQQRRVPLNDFIIHSADLNNEGSFATISYNTKIPHKEFFSEFLHYRDEQCRELQNRTLPGVGKLPRNYSS